MTEVAITERLALQPDQIDTDRRMLRDVAVLRSSSQQGRRRYTERAMQDVVELLPHTKSFADHSRSKETRPLAELLGSFTDGRLDGDVVRGSFRYRTEKSSLFEQLAADRPIGVAFSVNLLGMTRKDPAGVEVIESVPRLNSVDLVTEAGSTLTLWESAQGEPSDAQILAALGVTGRMLDAYEAPLGRRPEGKPDAPATPTPEVREPSDAEILAALR